MSRTARIALLIAALLLVALSAHAGLRGHIYRQLDPPPLAGEPLIDGFSSAQTCAGCHSEIAAEWARSGMGRAMSDPVFVADHADSGEFFWCLRCHAPLPEQQPLLIDGLATLKPLTPSGTANPDFDATLQSQGVTCIVCHQHDGHFVAGIADPRSPPHPARHDPDLVGVQTCTRCHQLDGLPFDRLDRPLLDTVGEWRRWQALTGRSDGCVDCHMPAITRTVAPGGPERDSHDHSFPGAWSDALLRSGLTISTPERIDGGIALTLTNTAGHGYPTGEPARAIVVSATLPDGTRQEVVLERRIDTPRLIERSDTTLTPGEQREIRLPFTDVQLDAARQAEITVAFERLRGLPRVVEAVGIPTLQHTAILSRDIISW